MRYILFVFTIIFFGSCNKAKNKSLPPITQNGANTFGCKINGEIFSVSGAYEPNNVGCASGNFISGSILSPAISSHSCDKDNPYNDVSFHLMEEYSIKTILLKGSGFTRGICSKRAPTTDYYTDSVQIGELIITRADSIIAGTFWFDAIEPNGSIVRITEGRFDISK